MLVTGSFPDDDDDDDAWVIKIKIKNSPQLVSIESAFPV